MLEDRSTIYAKVAPERIADVNWIMEGYEHLALVSTIDHQEGIILLRGTPDTYNDVLEIVENMPFSVEILESFNEAGQIANCINVFNNDAIQMFFFQKIKDFTDTRHKSLPHFFYKIIRYPNILSHF